MRWRIKRILAEGDGTVTAAAHLSSSAHLSPPVPTCPHLPTCRPPVTICPPVIICSHQQAEGVTEPTDQCQVRVVALFPLPRTLPFLLLCHHCPIPCRPCRGCLCPPLDGLPEHREGCRTVVSQEEALLVLLLLESSNLGQCDNRDLKVGGWSRILSSKPSHTEERSRVTRRPHAFPLFSPAMPRPPHAPRAWTL